LNQFDFRHLQLVELSFATGPREMFFCFVLQVMLRKYQMLDIRQALDIAAALLI